MVIQVKIVFVFPIIVCVSDDDGKEKNPTEKDEESLKKERNERIESPAKGARNSRESSCAKRR